jgi:heme-degrading monooxygenase HmoA
MGDRVYTHGRWVVLPGREEAFVAAWTDLARRSADLPGAERPTILRDRAQPNVFLTFGAFATDADVDGFRASDVFREGIARLTPLLASFEPHTLDEIGWA